MRYHNITKDDMLNGDGLRVVLWVAGCAHGCKGCHNQITWDPDGGLLFTEETRQEIYNELDRDYISGLTFSGGDPLYEANVEEVTAFAKKVKEDYPDKTIWLYTGSSLEQIFDLEVLRYVDVLVDGRFIEAKKDPLLHWRGSANQRVIDITQTLRKGRVILHGETSGKIS